MALQGLPQCRTRTTKRLSKINIYERVTLKIYREDTNMELDKVVRLGTISEGSGRYYSVYCHIKITDGRLSITGVEGPLKNGECLGACGQIDMHLKPEDISAAPGWSRGKIAEFLKIWNRWHLNDMKAGSPAQEEYLRDNPIEAVYPESHYEKACQALEAAGLLVDNGYKYGSAWLTEELPQSVFSKLADLPETDVTPAWA